MIDSAIVALLLTEDARSAGFWANMRGISAALLAFCGAVAHASLSRIAVDPQSGQFVDPEGRVRIFHGVNAVYKLEPWYPSNGAFDPTLSLNDQDMQVNVCACRFYARQCSLES